MDRRKLAVLDRGARLARAPPRTVLQQRIKRELDRYARIKHHHLSRACEVQPAGGSGPSARARARARAPSRCRGSNRSSCARAETWWARRDPGHAACNAKGGASACAHLKNRVAARRFCDLRCTTRAATGHAVHMREARAHARRINRFHLSLIQQGQRSGARHDVVAVVHGS